MEVIGRLPNIPEYFKLYINKDVDLTVSPKQRCPFHEEDTPSWSYSATKGIWRCFGGCKCGGDVIDLHRVNYHFKTRVEAERSLMLKHKVPYQTSFEADKSVHFVNEDKIERESCYQAALVLANRAERWLQLDYVMSKLPVDIMELEELVKKWRLEDANIRQ